MRLPRALDLRKAENRLSLIIVHVSMPKQTLLLNLTSTRNYAHVNMTSNIGPVTYFTTVSCKWFKLSKLLSPKFLMSVMTSWISEIIKIALNNVTSSCCALSFLDFYDLQIIPESILTGSKFLPNHQIWTSLKTSGRQWNPTRETRRHVHKTHLSPHCWDFGIRI